MLACVGVILHKLVLQRLEPATRTSQLCESVCAERRTLAMKGRGTQEALHLIEETGRRMQPCARGSKPEVFGEPALVRTSRVKVNINLSARAEPQPTLEATAVPVVRHLEELMIQC